jgi:RES domain-containing protein
VSPGAQNTVVAWRLTSRSYADHAFRGEGARLYGGRWNSEGVAMIYLASSLALAALEQLAHLSRTDLLEGQFVRFRVVVPEKTVLELDPGALPARWTGHVAATRALGDGWVQAKDSLALRVPSAVVPEENNYLVNPHHPDAEMLDIGAPEPFTFDPRLTEL